MNNFDKNFFKQYVPAWVEMKSIIHEHIIVILNKIVINYFLFVILPSFIYYYSDKIKTLLPFFVLEIFLIVMFIKIIYDIFDWYNDVWIVTDEWVTSLKWKLFWFNSNYVKYQNIEWIEIVQEWLFDTVLWIWDIIIHKIGSWEDERFILNNATVRSDAIEEIETHSGWWWHEGSDEEEENNENHDIIIKALSGVVEDYLVKNWYKKWESEEIEQYREKVRKKDWTIDLSE